ncbi:ribosomal subunit 39S-domain-containing protein [Xylariaceae sp. FL0255]|nr:ribosomal subunit 39S-domain-containing protein [Xylariaceae sp. FL0255]
MRRIIRPKRPSGLTLTSRSCHCPQQLGARATAAAAAAAPFSSLRQQRPNSKRPLQRFYSDKKQPNASEKTPVTTQEPISTSTESSSTTTTTEIKTQPAEIIEGEENIPDSEWIDTPTSSLTAMYSIPPPRSEAPFPDGVQDHNYLAAMTADGLEIVGDIKGWWHDKENWKAAGNFSGFKPRVKITDPILIEAAVRRSVVEALAVRQSGREESLLVSQWAVNQDKSLEKEEFLGLLAWELKNGANGEPVLSGGDVTALVEALEMKDVIEENAAAVEAEGVEGEAALEMASPSVEEIKALRSSWDPSWQSISLSDDRLRFAVTKRIFQLTGQRIPDHQLPSISSVRHILQLLKKPPKPATLTEEIQKRQKTLTSLPNVHVASKRITKGDKEEALGRLKVMQAELAKRGLPLTGNGGATRNRELRRLKGGL